MQVTTEELKKGWLHPSRVVRNVVAAHFSESGTTDPEVTAYAIRSVQEFGWGQFLSWGHRFCDLPLAEDAALEWVCGEVERTDEGAPSDNQKRHLTTMLAHAEIGLVERHQPRLLGLPSLHPSEQQAILTRLELLQCPPAEAWRRLEDHCRMAAAGQNFSDARIPEAVLLLEPLVRAGREAVPKIMDGLRVPLQDGVGNTPEEWFTGLMIMLAERLRVEEAVPVIWDLIRTEWDWYEGEGLRALTRIGTPGVVQIARQGYAQAPWSGRLHAVSLFKAIRSDESAAALEEALGVEDDDDLRSYLGAAAAGHLNDRLVPLALAVFLEDPDDPERGEIREELVTFSHLSGYDLPERDEWEREVNDYDDHISGLGDPAKNPQEQLLRDLFSGDVDGFGAAADFIFGERGARDDEPVASPVQSRSQVGRNAACPCGSGKKYKHCCLRDAPG